MAIGIIPARWGASRLPGKPLAMIGDRPLIVHVLQNAARAERLHEVLVATDDDRIVAAIEAAGGRAVLTASNHPSGTDRVAEAAQAFDDDIIVNIQGDEPEINPSTIDAVCELLERDTELAIATAASPLSSAEDHQSPHCVKVVRDSASRALYFSRAPIPHFRDSVDFVSDADRLQGELVLSHIGIYAYRRGALTELVSMPPSSLEQAEKLEQLRALEAGMKIGVAVVDEFARGIDTPDDLDAFRQRIEAANQTDRTGPK